MVLGLTILILGPLVAISIGGSSSTGAVALAGNAAGSTAAARAADADVVRATRHITAEPYSHVDMSVYATPTPAPTPRPKPRVEVPQANYPPGSIEAIIAAAANAHGVDPSWMIRIASCESGLRPNAYNPSGPYYGLFQFLMSTFKAHGGTNIWDPTQQSNIAAAMLVQDHGSAWPVCSKR